MNKNIKASFIMVFVILGSFALITAQTDDRQTASEKTYNSSLDPIDMKSSIDKVDFISNTKSAKISTDTLSLNFARDNRFEDINRILIGRIPISYLHFFKLDFTVTNVSLTGMPYRIDVEYYLGGDGTFVNNSIVTITADEASDFDRRLFDVFPQDPIATQATNQSYLQFADTGERILSTRYETLRLDMIHNSLSDWKDEDWGLSIVLAFTPGALLETSIEINYSLQVYKYDYLHPDTLKHRTHLSIPSLPFFDTEFSIEEGNSLLRTKDLYFVVPPSLQPRYLPRNIAGDKIDSYKIKIHIDFSISRSGYSSLDVIEVHSGFSFFIEDRSTFFDTSKMNSSLSIDMKDIYKFSIGNRGNEATLKNINIWIEFPDVLNNPYAEVNYVVENIQFAFLVLVLLLPVMGYQLVTKVDHEQFRAEVQKNEKITISDE